MLNVDKSIHLATLVLKAGSAEKIFLLGSTQAMRKTQSIFSTQMTPKHSVEYYYIMVLVQCNREQSNTALQDKIETLCAAVVPTTAFVIDIERFNDWLANGHPFACQVANAATCLFDSLRSDLAEPGIIDQESVTKERQQLYCRAKNTIQGFLAGADLFRIRRQNQLAAFMLHQATEQTLLTILKLRTGLSVTSHNLDKLLRYCSMVSADVSDVFASNSLTDNRLLKLLQRAYIDSRYKPTYEISHVDLLTVTDKLRRLQNIAFADKVHM